MSLSLSAVRWLRLWWLAALLAGCTDPYMPDIITTPQSFLVVDGFLNSQGITTVKLSRTFAVTSTAIPPVETKAALYIEEETGRRYSLQEGPNGTYTSAPLVLNPTKNHRLHIRTMAGQEYASDFVPVKTTPAIDELKWDLGQDGVTIYVSSHDPTNATQYYRWSYDETWEITPVYNPSVEYVNGKMRDIVVPYPTICWGSNRSTEVLLAKTAALSQDVVTSHPLRLVAGNSERLYSLYSILVRQYALTKEEYAYWDLMRKNTESIGSLFDPQPTQLTGNVHAIGNSADVALGFIGAHSVVEKRIFIRRQELPESQRVLSGYEDCLPADSISMYPDVRPPQDPAEVLRLIFGRPNYLPIDPFYNVSGRVEGYTGKSRDCVDCRTHGAAVKPSFWP